MSWPVKPPQYKHCSKTLIVGFLVCATLVAISRIHFLNTPTFNGLLTVNELLPQVLSDENYFPPADGDEPSALALLVNSSKCKIVQTKIMPDFWARNWKKIRRPVCRGRDLYGRLSDSDDDLFLLDERYWNRTCFLTPILRTPGDDYNATLLGRTRLEAVTNVSGVGMFSIYCEGGDHPNFDATVAISQSVQDKVDFWVKKKKLAEKSRNETEPISVLYIGIDSTSRSHFYRSFKKTSKLLEQLGFWDFGAHHSVAAYTVRNMFAMLAGYSTLDMTRAMRGWKKPYYDDCPWIWKEFSRRKYVTLNLQDRQTFNIDPSVKGFKFPPTDYYLRPMMVHMENYWDKLKKGNSKLFDDCLSPQTSSPSFVLNYDMKFMKRIGKHAPFFAFSFLGFPFHDFQLSHQNFDEDFYNFFNFLNTSGLLRKTAVIFGADHGDRVEFFGTEDIEGFVERSLPFLFIHVPRTILQENPQFRTALKHNTQVLTTHFDVHHTMLHLLALTDPKLALNFSPMRKDRSSLLRAIVEPRECSELNIESGMCVCDVGLSPHSVKDKHFLHRLYVFAVTQLNNIVRNSSYAKLCGDWTILPKPQVKAHIVRKPNSTNKEVHQDNNNGSMWQYLVFFSTSPYARFAVRIDVNVTDVADANKFVSLKLGGQFDRKGSYGTTSSCIVAKTVADRKFKELCYCKNNISNHGKN